MGVGVGSSVGVGVGSSVGVGVGSSVGVGVGSGVGSGVGVAVGVGVGSAVGVGVAVAVGAAVDVAVAAAPFVALAVGSGVLPGSVEAAGSSDAATTDVVGWPETGSMPVGAPGVMTDGVSPGVPAAGAAVGSLPAPAPDTGRCPKAANANPATPKTATSTTTRPNRLAARGPSTRTRGRTADGWRRTVVGIGSGELPAAGHGASTWTGSGWIGQAEATAAVPATSVFVRALAAVGLRDRRDRRAPAQRRRSP